MEIIIVIAIACVLGYWAYQNLNKEKSDGSHPLDAATTPKPSWPFPGGEVGEGKIHVKVADVASLSQLKDAWIEATEPAPTGSENRVETPTPVAEPAPAKKPAAKKTAAKPAAAKKTPAKKKSV
jgi:hypothetical protein